ncbi:MAG TPA: hypothetical protein VK013_10200 [Myxococcaceae bacterium]|nr:hypothetical protein [Myxococcaceae bacterium]
MNAGWRAWRVGALLTLLSLMAPGCRPLATTPPGCEGRAEDCEPDLPGSAAEVRLISPARLLEQDGGVAIFGRFLPVELEVLRSEGADEVELLCGDRRLATWWPSAAKEERLSLKALVDLLPCRAPGTDAHPLPVTLSVMVEDALGARRDHGRFDLLADFTVEEGEVLEPGDPDAPARARIELDEAPPTEEGLPALLRVEGVLSRPPQIQVGGAVLETRPVHGGWRFFLPRPDFGSDIDAFSMEVEVQVLLSTGFGVTTLLNERVRVERALRTVSLDGDLFSPMVPKPAGWPVMTSQGLHLVLEDTAATLPGSSARLVRIPADPSAPLQQLTFRQDTSGGPGDCAVPGDPVDPGTWCVLGMSGTGQLVLRRPQAAPLSFLISVLATDAWERWTPDTQLESLVRPAVADPAPFSQPWAWGRLGEARLCTEARSTSCWGVPCGPFPRACVLGSGAVESTLPVELPHMSWDAGGQSRARGGGPFFLTYDHIVSALGNVPLVTLGTETRGQLALGSGGSHGGWIYERGINAMVPVRDGLSMISLSGTNNGFYPGDDAQVEQPYLPAWADGRYMFHAIVHVEPDGSLVVLGEDWSGVQHLSRWAPESTVPEVEQVLPQGPDGFDLPPSTSFDLIEDGYSHTFADGSAVLVYRVGGGSLNYRLLVVDPQLRPLLRRRSTRPLRAELGPEGETLWLIETTPGPEGVGNQIMILPR